MKKAAAGILAILMAASLLACGGNGKDNTTGTTEAPSTTASGTEEKLNYSIGLLDNGLIDGVKALDLVKLDGLEAALVFKKADVDPSDDTVNEDISKLLASYAEEVTDKDYVIKSGDKVNIDYSGSMDGVAFEGGTATSQEVTAGSDEFIDNMLDSLIGKKAGDEYDVNARFPDPYPNNTAFSGKLSVFHIKINKIFTTPELNDAWVEAHKDELKEKNGLDDVHTVQDIKDRIFDYYHWYNLDEKIYAAVKAYAKDNVEVSSKAYAFEYDFQDVQVKASYGKSLQEMIDGETYTADQIREIVTSQAQIDLLFQAVAEKENWKVTDEDYKELTGQEDNTANIEKYGRGYMSMRVIYNRAFDYFEEKAKVE